MREGKQEVAESRLPSDANSSSRFAVTILVPAENIILAAHPDADPAVYGPSYSDDQNMIDYDNPELSFWIGKLRASQWCIHLNFDQEHTLETLEIDWHSDFPAEDYDILDMSEEDFAMNGTPECNGKVIHKGLSEAADGRHGITTSVIELNHYETSSLGIRINSAYFTRPIISEIRVKSWD